MVILDRTKNPEKRPKRFRDKACFVAFANDDDMLYDYYCGDYIYRVKIHDNEVSLLLDECYKARRMKLIDDYNIKNNNLW